MSSEQLNNNFAYSVYEERTSVRHGSGTTSIKTINSLYKEPETEDCKRCNRFIYPLELIGPVMGYRYHRQCFRCSVCDILLDFRNYRTNMTNLGDKAIYCHHHFPRNGKAADNFGLTRTRSKSPVDEQNVQRQTSINSNKISNSRDNLDDHVFESMETYNRFKSNSINSLIESEHKFHTQKEYHHSSKYSRENLLDSKKGQESSSSLDNPIFNHSGSSSSTSTNNYYNTKDAINNKREFSHKMYIEPPILIENDPNEGDYTFDKGFESITGMHRPNQHNSNKSSHLNGIMKDVMSMNGSNHSFNYNINDNLNHSFDTKYIDNDKNSSVNNSSSHLVGILTDIKDFEAIRPHNSSFSNTENYYSSSTQNYHSQSYTESGHYLNSIIKDAKISDASFKPLNHNDISINIKPIQPQPFIQNTIIEQGSNSNLSNLIQIVKEIKEKESKANKENVNNYIRQSSTSSYKDMDNYPTNIESVNKEIESYNSHLKNIMRDVKEFDSHNKSNLNDIDTYDSKLHLSGIIRDAHLTDSDYSNQNINKKANESHNKTNNDSHLIGIFREAKTIESTSTNKTTYKYEFNNQQTNNNNDKNIIGIAKEVRDKDAKFDSHHSSEAHTSSTPNLVEIVREIKEIQSNPNYKRQMSSNNKLAKADSKDSLDQHPYPHLYNIITEANDTDLHHAKKPSMSSTQSTSSHQHLNNIMTEVMGNTSKTTTHSSSYHYQSEVHKSTNTIHSSNSSINNIDTTPDGNSKNVKPYSKPIEIKVNELLMPLGENKGYGLIRLTVYYDNLRSRLSVTVHEARNLKNVDKKGASDPYAKIYLEPDGRPSFKRKTKIIKNNLNPTWQETFDYTMTLSEALTKQLTVTLKDEKGIFESKESKFLGEVIFHLKSVDIQNEFTRWFYLQPLNSVSILLSNSGIKPH